MSILNFYGKRNMNKAIELNRTFYELTTDFGHQSQIRDFDVNEALGLRIGRDLTWNDLLKQHRVVLLAEAGAGKTHEIRQTTRKLRSEGKNAFFFRLENMVDDISTAFEVGGFGDYEEFQEWLASIEEGWILLDSVDEARLKNPKDFENAIRKLAHIISPASMRTHVIITSRVTAWRPQTDISICNRFFPPVTYSSSDDNGDEIDKSQSLGFRIYSLTNLSAVQISKFAQEKGVEDHKKFLEEIDRQDAFAFTTRPQDLEEIIEYWNENRIIGTRFQLMENSVNRRLRERDQDRADAKPLDLKKIRTGARFLAAACTLTQNSTINVLDGIHNAEGIDVRSILSDWNDHDLQILLNRPVFDEAIYGSVRFHHRSVREYLTAEWFNELLKESGSRQKIENMFFRDKYGIQVIIQSMKPVLSWLVLLDPVIMDKVYTFEPEIILEGGDPIKLPLEKRKEILNSICQKIHKGIASRAVEERASIQRFASADLSPDIKQLILKYQDDDNVISYLLRMVWQGRIKDVLPETKLYSQSNSTNKYTRITAIRALKEIGTNNDFEEFLEIFIGETQSQHNRQVVAEIIESINSDEKSVEWILNALENVQVKEKYSFDNLSISLSNFIERSNTATVSKIIYGLYKLLKREPFIEKRLCEVSERYGWLLKPHLKAAEWLILAKDSNSLSQECLFGLSQAFAFKAYDGFENGLHENKLSELIASWKELNHALFWSDVKENRRMREKRDRDSLEYVRQISPFGRFWSFDESDFELIVQDISIRPLLGDRLIALSLAFQLYVDKKRPKSWLSKLKTATSDNTALQERLNIFLHPPAPSEEMKRYKKEDAKWKRETKKRDRKSLEEHKKLVIWLRDNHHLLRESGLEKGVLSQLQFFMLQKMKEKGDSSFTNLTSPNWKALVEDYGLEAAKSFRDGMVSFWKGYVPKLQSEKDDNTIENAVIFGLSGLGVDSAENIVWLSSLNDKDAEIACRYAIRELNGFPSWFYQLYEKFPALISKILLQEIDWELQLDEAKFYMLSRINSDCKWLWNSIAPELISRLNRSKSFNSETLGRALQIIQGSSSISDLELSEIAAEKCRSEISRANMSCWLAAWIGTSPLIALDYLSNHLKEYFEKDPAATKIQAMQVLVNLVGEHRTIANSRDNYKTPEHLKNLYVIMHQYIRIEEDIDRAGKGVYSPSLRDDAQEARSKLFSMLIEIPGKESFIAIFELSKMHPAENQRVWMINNAKRRAELDADFSPWSSENFCEFNSSLERKPSNHRELFELGVQRILDLKYQLEEGDDSIASTLAKENEEIGIRKVIANWCRDRSVGKYVISQEDELADGKKPDCRFLSSDFDAPVPLELKLADNWSGPELFERLENQLNGDYLRDVRSNRGIFVIVYRGKKPTWKIPGVKDKVDFSELGDALQNHWNVISNQYPKIEEIIVIPIDLTKRKRSLIN